MRVILPSSFSGLAGFPSVNAAACSLAASKSFTS
jgi:hypothetical protein